jgi:hypothetical protein
LPCGCGSVPSCNEGLALGFLERPAVRPAPTLCQVLSRCASRDAMGTYVSAEDASKLATWEYLHVDCRLMQAKQWGRVRSHCVWSVLGWHCAKAMHSLWFCARHIPRSSAWACCAFASSLVAHRRGYPSRSWWRDQDLLTAACPRHPLCSACDDRAARECGPSV